MSDSPTVAQIMVAKIETALAELPVGVDEVQVDGQRTKWSRAQALKELEYWRRRAHAGTSQGQGLRSFDLSGGTFG